MSEPLVPREDVQATIAARRELGPEHDQELVDAFVARIERRLDERGLGRERERTVARHRSDSRSGGGIAVAVVSMIAAIPLVAIAGGVGGGFGVLAVCVTLIVVNALYWEQTK